MINNRPQLSLALLKIIHLAQETNGSINQCRHFLTDSRDATALNAAVRAAVSLLSSDSSGLVIAVAS